MEMQLFLYIINERLFHVKCYLLNNPRLHTLLNIISFDDTMINNPKLDVLYHQSI